MTRRMAAAGFLGAAVLVAVAPPGATQPGNPKIDPKAEKHLKAMSSYLAGLKRFAFQAETSFDAVQDDGQKIQFSNQRKVVVSRPDKVFGEAVGDTADSQFYYNGATATVFDRGHKTYAVARVPGTIDAMLDDLHEKYGIEQPLSDLLFSDPYKVFTEHAQGGTYAGLHHVGKTRCHHLAFRQRLLDWQIWIDAGERPLPRKLVITFRRQPGEPQYTAVIHRWDVNPEAADRTFEFQPPAGVGKVDFLKRHGEPKAKKPPAGR